MGFDHEGTAALVQSRKSTWVVTSSHVVVGLSAARFWIGGKPLQPLGEETVYFCPPPADVAFFQLNEMKANAVRAAGTRFLSLAAFGSYEDGPRDCVVTGYPYRWASDPSVTIDPETELISAQQMAYQSTLLSRAKLEFVPGINRSVNVAVKADRMNEIESGKNISVARFDFIRLSGGIIWQRQSDNITRAIAIVTDHDPKLKLLLGTIVTPLIFKMAEKLGPDF